ncbi:MAG: transcriptional regulator, DegU/LuxR family [Sediminibacterium sp.]|nr:transcriptional regulator, DegU/LuxR family [Sediminibacterium sp.]
MNPIIHVGLVEDQLLFREGMKAIISDWPGIKVIFESADGFSVMDKLKQAQTIPDVMLVDLTLPPSDQKEFSGLDVTRSLLDQYPDIKIIMLSVHDDENYIAQLIEEGAHGYLLKDCDPGEVREAIEAVHKKGSYINEITLRAIQNNLGHKKKQKKPELNITKREEEILALVCQQFTAEEIAEKLFISVKTVNGHRNNLLQKTGSRNVTGLVIYAVKNHIIDLI